MAITIDNSAVRIATIALNANESALQTSLQRLSTGFRINSAKDDPAGLIASELLRADQASVQAAIGNAQRADTVMATADGGLSEISNLLVSLQGLVTQSANKGGLTPDEIHANQEQVDSIISTIDRLSNSTTFGGRKLLSGELGFTTSGGPGVTKLQGLSVTQGIKGESVQVQVLTSAQHATLVYHGGAGGLGGAVDLALAGNEGSINLSFASSLKASAMAAAVNQFSDSTGVMASANATDVAFISKGYGAAQFVSVEPNNPGVFQLTSGASGSGATSQSIGRDVTVAINGQAVTGNGLSVAVSQEGLMAHFALDAASNVDGATASFAIAGGGAQFALSPNLDSAGMASIGIDPVNSASLGTTYVGQTGYSLSDLMTGKALNLTTNTGATAQQVVTGAIKQVATLRGMIGGFRKYTIGSDINSLNVTLENLSSAESSIRDTDFAAETAEMTRRQILVQSSQAALAAANQSQQIILKLLGS
jgi:flagellin